MFLKKNSSCYIYRQIWNKMRVNVILDPCTLACTIADAHKSHYRRYVERGQKVAYVIYLPDSRGVLSYFEIIKIVFVFDRNSALDPDGGLRRYPWPLFSQVGDTHPHYLPNRRLRRLCLGASSHQILATPLILWHLSRNCKIVKTLLSFWHC